MQSWSHTLLAIVLVALSACSAGGGGDDAAPRSGTSAPPTLEGDSIVVSPSVTDPQAGASVDGQSPTPTNGISNPGAGRSPAVGRSAPAAPGPTTTVKPGPTTTVPPGGLPPEKCPDARTCRHHAFTTGSPVRYPASPDGTVVIDYWLNPQGLDTTYLSVEDAARAIGAAFDTWRRAAPSLRFRYRGLTDDLAQPGDGVNVVAFHGPGTFAYPSGGNSRPEFDITFATGVWRWAPCEQRDGACTRLSHSDLQSIATHEAGHALWLAHVTDDTLDREMTMFSRHDLHDRLFSTLALGEVLAIRALYPCSCPLPPIYSP